MLYTLIIYSYILLKQSGRKDVGDGEPRRIIPKLISQICDFKKNTQQVYKGNAEHDEDKTSTLFYCFKKLFL